MSLSLMGCIGRGAAIGGGIGLVLARDADHFATAIITGIALAALYFYAGSAAVAGTLLGMLISVDARANPLAGGLLGGCIGYALGILAL